MAAQLQSLLRFLSQDAKVPLAVAIAKVKELQNENLTDPQDIAKAGLTKLQTIFPDEKVAKQIISAAKRVSKKRAQPEESTEPSPKKSRKNRTEAVPTTPAEIEASVALPRSTLDEDELSKIVVFTNRAPLVLAFVVTLLRHSMPHQPMSSRLSLAQAYVSITSRSRAVYLGIESGQSAEEEGFGEGQPVVTIMGKEIRVMKRWGYEFEPEESTAEVSIQAADVKNASETKDEEPALWGIDLEALKKTTSSGTGSGTYSIDSTLPIYTPQSARAYLLKSFDTPRDSEDSKKKTANAIKDIKEANLGHLLKALDLLYVSWAKMLSPAELDQRTWGWYMAVRPAVADGVAGWGGKNTLALADILHLQRKDGG